MNGTKVLMSKKTVRIALIQTTSDGEVASNVSKTEKLIQAAADSGAKIICTQELCTTDYFCTDMNQDNFQLAETVPGPTTDSLTKLAKKNDVVLVLSLFEKRAEGIYHNTAVVIDADGSIAGVYRKMHIPDDPGFCEKYYFTPGDLGFKTIQTKYGKLGVLICWDQWFPEAARITAMQGADILIYPTAIATLPEESEEEKQEFSQAWDMIQRSHAIANGCFVASINRVGIENGQKFWGGSFICGPFGKYLAKAGEEEEIVMADLDFTILDKHRTTWPFFRDRRIDAYQPITKRFIDPE